MRKIIVFTAILAISSGCIHAQQKITFNAVDLKSPITGGAQPTVNYYEPNNVYSVHVSAASSANLTSNLTFKFPYTADVAGNCLVSLGSGQWNPGSCAGLTPPVTISGTTAGTILTVTQSGGGNGMVVTGNSSIAGNTTLTGTLSSSVLAVVQSGTGNAGVFNSSASVATVQGTNAGSGEGVYGLSTNGYGLHALSSNGTALYAHSVSGLAAEFQDGVKFDGSLSGTHAQNIGTGDSPTFVAMALSGALVSTYSGVNDFGSGVVAANSFRINNLGIGGTQVIDNGGNASFVSLTIRASGGLTMGTGTLSGTHLQNVGTGDSPTFSAITATSPGSTLYSLTVSNGLTVSANGVAVTGQSVFSASATSPTLLVQASGYTFSANFTDTGGTCRIGFASGGVTCPSDKRLKQDIVTLGSQLRLVEQLRPVAFRWIKSGERSDGLIAQEVQKIFPLAVHTGDDGYLNVSYQQLVPYLISAIQEQESEIRKLRGEMNVLKNKK
jgi:hypothetical protein